MIKCENCIHRDNCFRFMKMLYQSDASKCISFESNIIFKPKRDDDK